MGVLLSLALVVLLLGASVWASRRRTATTIDGYTIKLRRDREFVWVVYREPSGRVLTLEAHSQDREPSKLWVDLPSEIALYEREPPLLGARTPKLDQPGTTPASVGSEEATQIRERISQGLTRMKIQHEFVRPMRSGWTSFENGKEIYHG